MTSDNEKYKKAVEVVSLKNWMGIPPGERTDEELADFARVEPTEHIVGHRYTNGIGLVEEIYAEIADRLVRLGKENERLKSALKPVLDCELHIGDSLTEAVGEIGTSSEYGVCDEKGSDLWDEDIANNLNAVREAQGIFKESEHEITEGLGKENELLKQEIAAKDAKIKELRECLKDACDTKVRECRSFVPCGICVRECPINKWHKALEGTNDETK